jgi:hypothetical protein
VCVLDSINLISGTAYHIDKSINYHLFITTIITSIVERQVQLSSTKTPRWNHIRDSLTPHELRSDRIGSLRYPWSFSAFLAIKRLRTHVARRLTVWVSRVYLVRVPESYCFAYNCVIVIVHFEHQPLLAFVVHSRRTLQRSCLLTTETWKLDELHCVAERTLSTFRELGAPTYRPMQLWRQACQLHDHRVQLWGRRRWYQWIMAHEEDQINDLWLPPTVQELIPALRELLRLRQ